MCRNFTTGRMGKKLTMGTQKTKQVGTKKNS